jgi:hypothetical protein
MRKSVLACALFVAACGAETVKQEAAGTTSAVGLPASVVAAGEPAGAKGVAELKAAAKQGDAVVVRGVVGGDAKPIVAGRAVFTIGDVEGLALCTGEGESCPTPWDACCMDADAKAKNTLTVQFLGADGKPLAVDVEASGVKPMSTVVVAGKVGPRPDPKVLVIDATSVYVAKP